MIVPNLENIPAELKKLNQWVCANPNKRPINPKDGTAATSTDPNTWTSFEEAERSLNGLRPHIGFVLTTRDDYVIIDLDDPYKEEKEWTDDQRAKYAELNKKILDTFESYTETSQSGKGAHIVVKGKLPKGYRRDTVEVYAAERYMIFTGCIMKDVPIVECQDLLDQLIKEMGADSRADSVLQDEDDTYSDQEIVEMAMSASNADKFNSLTNGDWEHSYPSQSEADLALISIICFYTSSNEQVRRIFRMSALGKREKANKNDKYIDFAITRFRSNQPPPVDFEAIKNQVTEVIHKPTELKEKDEFSFPPGLVGQIADYIYKSAIRPVPEIGLAAAIAMVSGVVGRQYNVSGTGLNQYIILLAGTGTGKEGAASGIDRLMNEVRKTVPSIDEFSGPAAFASGPALIKTIADKPCFLSILGEFGLTLQQLCDPRANSAQVTLRQVLLDLYQKSGWHTSLKASVYSDKEKNTSVVQAPSLTILGESTPETFLDGLDEHHIADGLIPRFMLLEYTGKRPYLNKNAFFAPPTHLIESLGELFTTVLTMSNNSSCLNIQLTPEAEALSDEFEITTTDIVNAGNNEIHKQLWNRAHLKALKLAGLLAVGCNMQRPLITEELLTWAIDFIKKDCTVLIHRFEKGDIGSGDSKQLSVLRITVIKYLSMHIGEKGCDRRFQKDKVIPYAFLVRRVANQSAFKKDKRGATNALKMTLDTLIDSGELVEIPKQQMQERYKTGSRAFAITTDFKE